MIISVSVPGWLSRRIIASSLKKKPWLMGMKSNSHGGVELWPFTANYRKQQSYSDAVVKFIADGMEKHKCDALTFVENCDKFPSVKLELNISFD